MNITFALLKKGLTTSDLSLLFEVINVYGYKFSVITLEFFRAFVMRLAKGKSKGKLLGKYLPFTYRNLPFGQEKPVG